MSVKKVKIGLPSCLTVMTEQESFEILSPAAVSSVQDITVTFEEADSLCRIYLTAQTSAVKFLKIRWDWRWPAHVRFLGDAWERGYGELEWRGIVPNRFMPWYFCAANAEESICCGVKVRPNALCFWQTDTKGMTLFMDVRNGGSGVLLNGRRLMAAEVLASSFCGMSTFDAVSAFCSEMCTDPILPPYPVYGSNNWYYAYGKSSQEEILTDCDYIVKLTEGLENRPYMVIDDCWQENHRLDEYNGGPWTKGNEKFPDMKELASKISEKGARPGIWVRLLLNEDPSIPDEWKLSYNGCLDPTHPQALHYIQEDIRRICDWGYTLIKHDFSTYDLFGRWGFEMNPLMSADGWHFYDQSLTSAEVVKLLYKAILDASDSETIILGCNTIGHLGAGYMHMNRTGDDTSGVDWERTRRMGINTLAFRLPQHRRFYEVDADCVGIDGTVPWYYNRQWAKLLAESGTSLFVSARPGLLSEEENKQLADIMAIASRQDLHLQPTDWEDTDCPEQWEDAEHKLSRSYDWYEPCGVRFKTKTIRALPYLSMIE